MDVVHETGHFIGLDDRYSDDKSGKRSEAHNGFKNDLMGDNSANLVQAHYDDLGNYAIDHSKGKESTIAITYYIDLNRKSKLNSKE